MLFRMIKRNRVKIEIKVQHKDAVNYNVHLIISSVDRRGSVDISQIVRCEAIKSEVIIVVTNDRLIKIRTGIRHLSSLLKNYHFIRIHKTAIVNTIHIDRYQLDENCLIMADGGKVPVSKSKRKLLLKTIDAISNNYKIN